MANLADDEDSLPHEGATKRYLVQTASLYFIGTMQDEKPDCLVLVECVVVLNTGRLDILLRDGTPTTTFSAVELPPALPVRIERHAIIWGTPWVHPKPKVPIQ